MLLVTVCFLCLSTESHERCPQGSPIQPSNHNHNNQTFNHYPKAQAKQAQKINHTSKADKNTQKGFNRKRGVSPRGDWEPRVCNLGLRSGLQSNATTPRAITRSGNEQSLIRVNYSRWCMYIQKTGVYSRLQEHAEQINGSI